MEHVIQDIGMQKQIINIRAIMIKIWNHHISNILDANNLYGWAMSQKLRLNGFKWVEELSQFKEDFIKKYDEDSNKGYFFEVDVEYPKNLFCLHSDLLFLPERNKM